MGFEIDKLSGEIYTTNSLRKQGNSHVALKVLAKNHGVITGMDVDETLVYVSVTDTNDPPVFTPTSYIANITEDSPAGTSVVTVSALDQDSILDWNRFFFSIENGNTNFSFAIDPSSGLISVNSPLDRELWPVYNLTVTATDNGSPPATGTTTVISNVTISHITSDPCLTSPCQNRATCSKNIFISQEVSALESVAVIFVSPQKEIFNCTCPVGFTGLLCEGDINECELNPCENRGTCVNTEGSFYCHCQSGFSGSVCSADGDECMKVKCQNGATCTPSLDGYHCDCKLFLNLSMALKSCLSWSFLHWIAGLI
uniref:Uncharacterized protein n=1 Tax=Amphiprion ocellaris TaxID=80972 RepID=A0AAQ5ZHN2_AMPOC